jgi:hypothetical protein
MDAVLSKPVLKLASAAIMIFFLPFYLCAPALSWSKSDIQITHTVPLGIAKNAVLKMMGKPNCPVEFDFSYKKKGCEILVTFDDKTNSVEAVIVIGKNPEYSVMGITGGSPKYQVKKVFGDPEKRLTYKSSGAECWYYPSKKVNFAFEGDKVTSFSISSVQY